MTDCGRRWLAATIVGCCTAMPGMAAAQATSDPPPPYAAPGRLIDVGGWRLHLNCTGTASPTQPTVILEAGLGDFSVEWSLVQPQVAGFARVCSYDRAGDGWSDLGPHPRTLHQIVYELHTLLARAGERPPYVLVGHSYGGWLVRLYQATYPAEVAGLVLVEGGAEDPLRLLGDGRLAHASDLATGKPLPPVKTAGPLTEADVPGAALAAMKRAASASVPDANAGPRSRLPAEAQAMRTWALGRWQHIAAAVNPAESDELVALRADRQARGEHPLGDLPLVVLTRGLPEEEGPDAAAVEAEHREEHTALAHWSTRGELVVAEHSGHHIQLEQPDLVVSAIRRVLAQASR